jgi:hypothetical protein
MNNKIHKTNPASDTGTRRDFFKNSFQAVAGSMAVLAFPAILHGQSRTALNAVVIGMGGRGGGAGGDFLQACREVGVAGKIVAVADLFPNQSYRGMKSFGLSVERCFSGFDPFSRHYMCPM